jgi:hypothetical protein
MRYIIRRHIKPFSLDLAFTGSEVLVKCGEYILDCHCVKGLREGAKKMREIEEDMNRVCQAMC